MAFYMFSSIYLTEAEGGVGIEMGLGVKSWEKDQEIRAKELLLLVGVCKRLLASLLFLWFIKEFMLKLWQRRKLRTILNKLEKYDWKGFFK